MFLLRLEEQDGAVAEVEVDEVLRLVRHKTAKVASNDAVPGGALSLIEGLLDVLRDVLLDRELGHGFLSNFDGLLLHIFGHIGALDLSFKLLPGSRGSAALDVVSRHYEVDVGGRELQPS